jgi:putative nucleotidyltransferase with HDIG domain
MNFLETVQSFIAARNARAYLVGGAVRDRLLGQATHDLDIAVAGSAAGLGRALADSLGGSFYVMDETFDVARVILDHEGTREIVDFARLRGDSVVEDLAARDFTLNAMAADARTWTGDPGEVIDPFHGVDDLGARRLRVVSEDVFRNDPVRLLRAVRFEAELLMALDPPSEALVRRDAPQLAYASLERVRDEMLRILAAPNVLRQLRRLDELGLCTQVVPELEAARGVTQSPPHVFTVLEHSWYAVAAAAESERAGYLDIAAGAFARQLQEHFAQTIAGECTRANFLRLVLLLHDIGKPTTRSVEPGGRIRYFNHEAVGAEMVEAILRRLKFSNLQITLAKTIVAHHLRPFLLTQSGISDRAVYRFFRDTGSAGVDIAVHAWCDQRATYGDGMPAEVEASIQAVIGRLLDRYYHAHLQVVSPPALVNGRDVMDALQLLPGPEIGKWLEQVREAQAAGQIKTREQALAFLARSGETPRGRAPE